MTTISIIAAMAENRVIGKDNKMPWHIPGELKIFREHTMGKTLILGRKTHESIGRVLPGRTTIIITRQEDYEVEGAYTVHSLEEALILAKSLGKDIMIGGGGEIFSQALDKANQIYLSIIHASFEGETYFPEFSSEVFQEISRKKIDASIPYSFVVYKRIK